MGPRACLCGLANAVDTVLTCMACRLTGCGAPIRVSLQSESPVLQFRVVARDCIEVYPPSSKGRPDLYFPLHVLLSRLPEVPVHGIPTIQRCVINRQKNGRFQLFAEGVNLRVSPRPHVIWTEPAGFARLSREDFCDTCTDVILDNKCVRCRERVKKC